MRHIIKNRLIESLSLSPCPSRRYSLVEEYTEPPMNPFSSSSSQQTTPSPPATLTATPQPVNIIYSNQLGGSQASSPSSASSAYTGGNSINNNVAQQTAPAAASNNQFQSSGNSSSKPSASRKGGVIFPSIKNKPSVANSTFATDLITLKDVKVSRHCCCLDLLCLENPISLSSPLSSIRLFILQAPINCADCILLMPSLSGYGGGVITLELPTT